MPELSLTEILLSVIALLQFVLLVFVAVLWRRQNPREISALKTSCEDLQIAQGRLETVVREEVAHNRREAADSAREARAQATAEIGKLSDQFVTFERTNQQFREHLSDKLAAGLNAFAQSLIRQLNEHSASTKGETAQLRAELFNIFEGFGSQVGRKINESVSLQEHQFGQLDEKLAALGLDNGAQLKALDETLGAHLEEVRRESAQSWLDKLGEDAEAARQTRQELNEVLARLMDSVVQNFALSGEAQRGQFDSFSARMDAIAQGAERRAETLRVVVDERLQGLQSDNAHQLERMRQTVDEKLQGTLNERLGASFRAVSERLELVHARTGRNARVGRWRRRPQARFERGENARQLGRNQLGNLLEQMLSPAQYERQIETVPGNDERADFAIRLPGQEGQESVWLPIDASFSQEDYAALLDASEAGDKAQSDELGAQWEARVRERAREISEQLMRVPHTTDFAILFLPTEGLYAETIRRAGLVESLQTEYRVTVAGPMTLASILNALQMGFRTLAIQEQSREIWDTLGAVKTEFGKYGDVLDAVQKKLQEASEKIDDTRASSRTIERQLRDVEATAEQEAPRLKLLGAEARDGS